MKKVLCLMLCLTFLLSGCAVKDMTKFYYRRAEFLYEEPDGVIVSEERDITGHGDDLEFLLSLYLMGPLEESLRSPFPTHTELISVEKADGSLVISLSEAAQSLSDSEYTLGCACLALTCIELIAVDSVTVLCGERSVTIDPELLTMYDSGIPSETTNGG